MSKEYLLYLLKSFFVTLPAAVVRWDPGWRWFVADIARTAFVYETMLRIPIMELSDLYPGVGEHPIVIPSPRASQKSTEWVALASLVVCLKPRTIFEFGTSNGGGTLLLAKNAKGATIYTSDLSHDDRDPSRLKANIGAAFKGMGCEKRIVQLLGNSTKFDYTTFVGQIDFVFIDASHDYESVKSDTKNALDILSPQGVIIWHDFPSSLGVRRYLLEFAKKHRVFQIYGTRLALYDPHIKKARIHQYWGWE